MANPNPSRITDASWWLMQELLRLQPGTKNGGLYANKSGYHNTRAANDANWPGDYSVRDAVDRQGPADKCAAYDWTFPDAQAGNYTTIARYTKRLIASAKDVDDPRLNGWKEFFGNADSDSYVEGWDTREGHASTSDSSHLWHIHLSESRALVGDMDNKKALLSVLKGETTEEWRNGGGETMAGWFDVDDMPNRAWRGDAGTNKFVKRGFGFGAMWDGIHNLEVESLASKARQVAILEAVKGVDAQAILAHIDDLAAQDKARDEALLAEIKGIADGGATAEEIVDVLAARLGG